MALKTISLFFFDNKREFTNKTVTRERERERDFSITCIYVAGSLNIRSFKILYKK